MLSVVGFGTPGAFKPTHDSSDLVRAPAYVGTVVIIQFRTSNVPFFPVLLGTLKYPTGHLDHGGFGALIRVLSPSAKASPPGLTAGPGDNRDDVQTDYLFVGVASNTGQRDERGDDANEKPQGRCESEEADWSSFHDDLRRQVRVRTRLRRGV